MALQRRWSEIGMRCKTIENCNSVGGSSQMAKVVEFEQISFEINMMF